MINRVREIREARGFSQVVLAERAERLAAVSAEGEEYRTLAFGDVIVCGIGSYPAREALDGQPQLLVVVSLHN